MKYRHSETDDTILADISATIKDRLVEWYGDQGNFLLTHPEILTYQNCFIIRFLLRSQSGVSKNILVKIRRHPKMHSLSQAVLKQDLHGKIPAEYQELETIYSFFGNWSENLGAVRPLTYIEKYYAIVMEEFQSQTLREILMSWGMRLGFKRNIKYLLNAAELTGKWLNIFHGQMHKRHETKEPYQPIFNEVQELIDRLKTVSQQHNLASSFQNEFFEKITSVESRGISYSAIHGDMTCDNVLYSKENKVCMIDVKTRHAPIYSDIGLILIHPDTFMLQIFSFGLFFRKQYIQMYRAAIIKGYLGDQNEIDNTLINLYCAIKMLDKWVMYEEIASKTKGWKSFLSLFAVPMLRVYFKPRIKNYLDLMTAA
ncbi:MAG: hypothetical protein HZB50_14560 [Chloroflexi bacterium]|nr:hypothetical protein [Chloroflexota bacterium]